MLTVSTMLSLIPASEDVDDIIQAAASRCTKMVLVVILTSNRLLFNPIVQWWRKGPINGQIHRFLWSKAPIHYKISMLACKLVSQLYGS